MIVNKLVYHLISPKVGDIVCFTLPDQAAYHFEDPISGAMKRVAAIGGETVQVTNGLILVNGTRRDFNIRADASPPSRADTNIYSFGENENPYLTYGVHQPYLVPEGHYFLLGDNLSHSADSRSFGAIDQRSITGKAVKICWPFHRIANVR